MPKKGPIFKNKENEEITLPDGRTIWLSRSNAVVGIIFGIVNNNIYVLSEKRSAMMDEPNKWAVISGYIDWDENGMEALIRETYEETSFYIPQWKNNLVFNNNKEPFYVHTDPKTDAKQNISLTYIFIYKFKELPKEVEQYTDKEIDEVKWIEISEVFQRGKQWAFFHDERIATAVEKFEKYLI